MTANPANAYWSMDAATAFRNVESKPEGLTSAEAAQRLRRDGPNSFGAGESLGVARLLWRQFESPLVLILVFASGVALLLRDWTEATIILAIVLGSTALGFGQEYRASRAAAALRARLALRSRVLRDGVEIEALAADLVVGDVVLLSAGKLVPADGLLLDARDFLVSEASLTGEPFPVEKRPGAVAPKTELAERRNCAFAGSSVRSGEARVLICATGAHTQFGRVAERLRAREPETEFARGLRRFGNLVLRVMILLVCFVLVINQLLGRPFFESLLFSVALAVGMSPELLPAIVSVTLSAGANRMAARGVLVRRLEAIENLGGIDILCTDKTGTITEGVVALQGALDSEGKPSADVMKLGFANAALETGIVNPLDQAIVAAGAQAGLAVDWRKLDEIPYDFQRKRLTIVVDDGADSRLIVVKGAFKEVLEVCDGVARGPQTIALDEAERRRLEALYRDFGQAGLRALAVATRRAAPKDDYTREDERAMTLVGFLTFLDRAKPDAHEALDALRQSGVTVKVITGDNRYVAANIADAVGLDATAILTGAEIDALKGEALAVVVQRAAIFAEVDPEQKERIVRALQKKGHTVGFLGDGVNDAPALHAADVGISVDGAVDVAREAADMILLKRDLGVLREGIANGRRTTANTLKYICITTGSSFGNMVSMALATPLLPFLPLTATQVLLTNFLSDIPLVAVTTDDVDPETVARPERWRIGDIQSFMLVFGLVSSAFDLVTFILLHRIFHADETTFHTAWFIISVLTEIGALLVLRTRRPAWKSRPGRWIVGLSIAVAALTIAMPLLGALGRDLGLAPLSAPILIASLLIFAGYVAATEAVKALYYKRRA